MGFHVISTTPIFEPLPIQLSYWYQKKILGFKYAYSEDGVIGKLYKVTFHETPPVNVDGFVDVDASLLKFSTLSKEKLEGLFAGVPYHFKPDIVAITGVPNKEIIIKSPHGTKFEK